MPDEQAIQQWDGVVGLMSPSTATHCIGAKKMVRPLDIGMIASAMIWIAAGFSFGFM